MLVKISNSVSVNPDHVASVEVNQGYADDVGSEDANEDYLAIVVTMTDGRRYNIEPRHGEKVWQAHERLTRDLNGQFGAA